MLHQRKYNPPSFVLKLFTYIIIFLIFWLSLGHTCCIWKFPGHVSNQSGSCRSTPQPQPHWIRASSAACTLAHNNARSFNPCSEAMDQTHILMDNGQVCYHRATKGTPLRLFKFISPDTHIHTQTQTQTQTHTHLSDFP